MTFKEEIIIVLKKHKRPMTCEEIFKEILNRGKIKFRTSTPKASLSSIINTDIKEKREKSYFIKINKIEDFKAKSYYSLNSKKS